MNNAVIATVSLIVERKLIGIVKIVSKLGILNPNKLCVTLCELATKSKNTLTL